jgi:hypothetical protein
MNQNPEDFGIYNFSAIGVFVIYFCNLFVCFFLMNYLWCVWVSNISNMNNILNLITDFKAMKMHVFGC